MLAIDLNFFSISKGQNYVVVLKGRRLIASIADIGNIIFFRERFPFDIVLTLVGLTFEAM
jgi:hypothetical protein